MRRATQKTMTFFSTPRIQAPEPANSRRNLSKSVTQCKTVTVRSRKNGSRARPYCPESKSSAVVEVRWRGLCGTWRERDKRDGQQWRDYRDRHGSRSEQAKQSIWRHDKQKQRGDAKHHAQGRGRARVQGEGRGAGQGRVLGSDAKLLAALHTVGQSVGAQSNQNGFTGMGT